MSPVGIDKSPSGPSRPILPPVVGRGFIRILDFGDSEGPGGPGNHRAPFPAFPRGGGRRGPGTPGPRNPGPQEPRAPRRDPPPGPLDWGLAGTRGVGAWGNLERGARQGFRGTGERAGEICHALGSPVIFFDRESKGVSGYPFPPRIPLFPTETQESPKNMPNPHFITSPQP